MLLTGAHEFRKHRRDRFRHRLYRKAKYVPEKIRGQIACVGCGRCVAACLPDIANPASVYKRLIDDLGVVLHVPKGPVPDGCVPRGAGAEVVFFNLRIEVLAGELERILCGLCALCGKHLPERLISVVVLHCACFINHQPYRAEPVVEVEVLLIRSVPVVLGEYLPVSINVCLCQRAVGWICLTQYPPPAELP